MGLALTVEPAREQASIEARAVGPGTSGPKVGAVAVVDLSRQFGDATMSKSSIAMILSFWASVSWST